MASDLYRLTYVSTAAPMTDGALETLVQAACEKNGRMNVQGLLLFNGLNFLQTLEGQQDAVGTLFERIAADPRHTGVKIIAAGEAAEAALDGGALTFWTAGTAHLVTRQIPAALPEDLRTMYLAFASLNAIERRGGSA